MFVGVVSLTACSPSGANPEPTTAPDTGAEFHPYEVVEPVGIGVKVQSCDVEDCIQVGTARNGMALTVECQSRSGFYRKVRKAPTNGSASDGA
jgi:hypothetical protein